MRKKERPAECSDFLWEGYRTWQQAPLPDFYGSFQHVACRYVRILPPLFLWACPVLIPRCYCLFNSLYFFSFKFILLFAFRTNSKTIGIEFQTMTILTHPARL